MPSDSITKQPKKRGRPPKQAQDEDESIQNRRAQVRRAQHAFRIRKEAAQKAQEAYIRKLETTVEEMSTVVLDFTDSVIKSDALQRDSDTLQKLMTTVRKIVDLTNAASADQTSEMQSIEGQSPTQLVVSARFDSPPGLTLSDTSSPPNDFPLVSSYSMLNDYTAANREDDIIDIPISDMADFPPDIDEAFNNSFSDIWANQDIPLYPKIPDRPSERYTVLDINSIGIRLLQITLELGVKALTASMGSTDEKVDRFFKFSLMYHSREELLFHLKWFLGPGFGEIHKLGDIKRFGSHPARQAAATELRNFFDGRTLQDGTKIPSWEPVESSDVGLPSDYEPFVGAFDIVEYLKKLGARYLDPDTIEIRANVSGTLQITGSSPTRDISRHEIIARAAPELWHSSTFDALLGGAASSSSVANDTAIPSSKDTKHSDNPQTLLLGVSSLLYNLSSISLCLVKGPGYYRHMMDDAIAASLITPALSTMSIST